MPYYVCPRCGGREGFLQSEQKWTTYYDFPDTTPRNYVNDEWVYFCSDCKTVRMDSFSTAEEDAKTRSTIKKVLIGILVLIFVSCINFLIDGRQSTFTWPPKKISLMGVNTDVQLSEFHESVNPNFLVRFNPSEGCYTGVSCTEVQYISRFKCKPVMISVVFSNSMDGATELVQGQDSDGTEGIQKDGGEYFVFAGHLKLEASSGKFDKANVFSIKCAN